MAGSHCCCPSLRKSPYFGTKSPIRASKALEQCVCPRFPDHRIQSKEIGVQVAYTTFGNSSAGPRYTRLNTARTRCVTSELAEVEAEPGPGTKD
jgi:hypothetical protein